MTHARFLPGRRAVVLAGGSLALGLLPGVPSGAVKPARAGEASSDAPDALYEQSFARLDQGEVAMREFLGKPLVLNFWASWCPPCVKEMPDLDGLAQAHPRVGFVGLAVDSAVNVQRFLQKTQVSYPILVSGHGGIAHMRALGNRQGGLPFTVLFDAEGRVQRQVLGVVNVGQFDGFLRALDA